MVSSSTSDGAWHRFRNRGRLLLPNEASYWKQRSL